MLNIKKNQTKLTKEHSTSDLVYRKIFSINECENEDLIKIVIQRLLSFQPDHKAIKLLEQAIETNL